MSQSTNISLEGRTALITGGASGIGEACARAFSRAGATVTVCDQNEQAVKELAEEIGGRLLGRGSLRYQGVGISHLRRGYFGQ